MTKAQEFNLKAQRILEQTFRYEAAMMAQYPGGQSAVRDYSNRLHANRKKLEKEVEQA